jgi:DUF1680 family protein
MIPITQILFLSTTMFSMTATFALNTEPARDYLIRPVPFTQVHIDDSFWAPRIETNRTVTIPFALKKNEETGRVDNFRIAARLKEGKYMGERYNDTDIYKVLEGAAYSLVQHPDRDLEKNVDGLVDLIAQAQEPDGYLFTARTCDPAHPAPGTGAERWSELAISHELYNAGHMYEAAVAYYQATGKRKLLDVAIKNADLVNATFGHGKRQGVPGHQEIELGLVKLYRATGDAKYLKLAQYFLDARGTIEGFVKQYPQGSRWAIYNDPVQIQAHQPILEQDEAVGHAVRAAYMYSGMADVAALTGDPNCVKAIDRLWKNVVGKKLYLTGGLGARHERESFGAAYELPNDTAYNETCAAIGNVFWNARLFWLHGDASYIDVLERTAYNGMLAGVSLSGDRFFYPNPLSSDGKYPFNQGSTTRAPWFGVACCPGNVTRFLPSFPGYIYAHTGDTLYVNLFVAGHAEFEMGGRKITVRQETRYPWEGDVRITLAPDREGEFTVAVRIPGWSRGEAIPGNLYEFLPRENDPRPTLKVNHSPVSLKIENGFVNVRRTWKKGDAIQLQLPMPIRRVVANLLVEADRGRVALQRGPLVYCAEAMDQPSKRALHLALRDNGPDFDRAFKAEWRRDLLGGVMVITGRAIVADETSPPASRLKEQAFTAIPYYAWANRGPGEMTVWFKRISQP